MTRTFGLVILSTLVAAMMEGTARRNNPVIAMELKVSICTTEICYSTANTSLQDGGIKGTGFSRLASQVEGQRLFKVRKLGSGGGEFFDLDG